MLRLLSILCLLTAPMLLRAQGPNKLDEVDPKSETLAVLQAQFFADNERLMTLAKPK